MTRALGSGDAHQNNTQAVTDVLLEEPVTAQEWRLVRL